LLGLTFVRRIQRWVARPELRTAVAYTYLDGQAFGEVVRDMWHEVLLLRVEGKYVLTQPSNRTRASSTNAPCSRLTPSSSTRTLALRCPPPACRRSPTACAWPSGLRAAPRYR